MKGKLVAITLSDQYGWRKRLFFESAEKEALQRLLFVAEKLALSGASREEILLSVRGLAKSLDLKEVAH